MDPEQISYIFGVYSDSYLDLLTCWPCNWPWANKHDTWHQSQHPEKQLIFQHLPIEILQVIGNYILIKPFTPWFTSLLLPAPWWLRDLLLTSTLLLGLNVKLNWQLKQYQTCLELNTYRVSTSPPLLWSSPMNCCEKNHMFFKKLKRHFDQPLSTPDNAGILELRNQFVHFHLGTCPWY